MNKSWPILATIFLLSISLVLGVSDRVVTVDPKCCFNDSALTVYGFLDTSSEATSGSDVGYRCYTCNGTGFPGVTTQCTGDNLSSGYISDELFCDMGFGLGSIGDDTGNFLVNLAPGVGTFLIILAIFTGIVGIIGGVMFAVRRWTNR